MTVTRADIGFVSTDRSLVDFFVRVFELEEIDPIVLGPGTVHRLQLPGAILKVMVPAETPTPLPTAKAFYGLAGLRYLTIWVEDLDALVDRALAHGARVTMEKTQLTPDVRIAVLADPDGNAIEVAQRFS